MSKKLRAHERLNPESLFFTYGYEIFRHGGDLQFDELRLNLLDDMNDRLSSFLGSQKKFESLENYHNLFHHEKIVHSDFRT
mgnify:CR=1 FL=1